MLNGYKNDGFGFIAVDGGNSIIDENDDDENDTPGNDDSDNDNDSDSDSDSDNDENDSMIQHQHHRDGIVKTRKKIKPGSTPRRSRGATANATAANANLNLNAHAAPSSADNFCARACRFGSDLLVDLWMSSGLVANHKLNWLLIMGPVALMGDATGLLGETACFAFSGIALIPCAERLSFVTEQVAMHTNGTIGALLNATFGNAPELLIASAALRKGFYRVVQLAMLGSMLTNLLFVFGISCLIGGLRWQVQELRVVSGNVSVGMLLMSVAGSLLPATLVLGGQLKHGGNSDTDSADEQQATQQPTTSVITSYAQPSLEELRFCRINAFVMIFMYGCYVVFQLGTHKEEFDEDDTNDKNTGPQHNQHHKARRNLFCAWLVQRTKCMLNRTNGNSSSNNNNTDIATEEGWMASPRLITAERRRNANTGGTTSGDVEMMYRSGTNTNAYNDNDATASSDEECLLPQNHHKTNIANNNKNDSTDSYFDEYLVNRTGSSTSNNQNESGGPETGAPRLRRANNKQHGATSTTTTTTSSGYNPTAAENATTSKKKKNGNSNGHHHHNMHNNHHRSPGALLPLGLAEPSEAIHIDSSLPQLETDSTTPTTSQSREEAQMSFRVGILWLFIITLGISAMSDILVDTIDGFALRLHFSEVFTSMVIVPFFSNVAEQVSSILFAYRNEMDLCVGVTVGSAIQVAAFVLPGCVIIGWMVDRSMTLYFHAYETVCLFLAVIVVAAVLQGGTTNWLVGATCISVYVMMATGFWFHSLEDLSVDAETIGLGGDGD
eukprot:CAMPEP_0168195858 /NCGR_PEP_ID=MMETSP0139_2-20121125/20138_1 /TAXON_ID=44445 /ORGANISM="Pseudo-nitzschia australis, Strain 10249 10 AB" /LENGTH=781 /DNA_ID=CAMNT_0008119857 /DNA_START=138 /DNA_END=2483 /DNA_ORIENTATION=+